MRTGDLFFNTDDQKVYVYDGTSWVIASGGGGGGASINSGATAPESPEEGDAWFNTTEGRLYVYYDSFWIEVGANGGAIGPEGPMPDVSGDIKVFEFTATASQTVFNGNDRNDTALTFTSDQLLVFLNGVLLSPGDDFTTGTDTVTLVSGASDGDELVVVGFSTFSVADTYTIAQADAEFATKAELEYVEALALLGL
jgi:hypothetical protein